MPSRRDQIVLTAEEQRRYLDESHTIMLSSLDKYGYPHTVAMWYIADPDGTVSMTTFAKSQKTLNLQRDPRCSLLLESGRRYEDLKGLLIRGRAELDRDTEHVLDVLERIHKKYNRVDVPGMRAALLGQARKRVVVRVHPERVASWDHHKLAGTY